jgi:molecular chaperone GrpE
VNEAVSPAPTAEEMSYLEQLQRLQAEFSNYRRRIDRERTQWYARAKGELLTILLPILDDLARARDSVEENSDSKDAEGFLMILARLESALASIGLEVQKTEPGTPFDPNYHEALMTAPSEEYPEGLILQTLQCGYVYQDQLLRPARVTVSAGPQSGPEALDSIVDDDATSVDPAEAS